MNGNCSNCNTKIQNVNTVPSHADPRLNGYYVDPTRSFVGPEDNNIIGPSGTSPPDVLNQANIFQAPDSFVPVGTQNSIPSPLQQRRNFDDSYKDFPTEAAREADLRWRAENVSSLNTNFTDNPVVSSERLVMECKPDGGFCELNSKKPASGADYHSSTALGLETLVEHDKDSSKQKFSNCTSASNNANYAATNHKFNGNAAAKISSNQKSSPKESEGCSPSPPPQDYDFSALFQQSGAVFDTILQDVPPPEERRSEGPRNVKDDPPPEERHSSDSEQLVDLQATTPNSNIRDKLLAGSLKLLDKSVGRSEAKTLVSTAVENRLRYWFVFCDCVNVSPSRHQGLAYNSI